MIKDKQKPEAHWISKSAMAASLGISVRSFHDWKVAPAGKIGREVYFTVRDVLANRLANEASKQQPVIAGEDDASSIDFERYRLVKAQADAQELKNEMARGEVVPVDMQTYVLGRCMAEAAGILDTLPLTVKRKHPELTQVQIDSIKREVVRSQNAIARGYEYVDQYLDDFLDSLGVATD